MMAVPVSERFASSSARSDTEIRVRTFKAKGRLLSKLAHDLEFRLEAFELGFENGKVSMAFQPASLVVEGAVVDGRVRPGLLGARYEAEITDNVRRRVLLTDRHPLGRFDGDYVEDGDRVRVEGTLRLLDQAHPLEFELRLGATSAEGVLELQPSRWGIAPFSAMLGALRLEDRVEVFVRIAAVRAGS